MLAIAAAGVSAAGTIAGGNSAAQAASYQARQLRMRARQAEAEGQQKAEQDRRESAYMQSRLRALAAASGAGATDKTVLDIMGRISNEGEYRALADLWLGSEQSAQLNQEAGAAQYSGKTAQQQSRIAAFGTMLQGGANAYGMSAKTAPNTSNLVSDNTTSSLYEKYGLSGSVNPLNDWRMVPKKPWSMV
jgi:hypothetical protein